MAAYNSDLIFIKGVVHPKIKMCWKCTHPLVIWDVDEFVSSSEQIWRICPLLSSYIKIHQHICLELFWTVFACKQCLICAYFSPDPDKMNFPQKKYQIRGLLF